MQLIPRPTSACRIPLLLLLLHSAAAFQFAQHTAPTLQLQQGAAAPFRLSKHRTHYVQQHGLTQGSLQRGDYGGRTSATAATARGQPTELVMPKVSPSTGNPLASTGFISTWHAQEGQRVNRGDALFVVESDKADVDVEAPHDGVLRKILVREGVRVDAGSVVGLLEGEAASAGVSDGSEAGEGEPLSNPSQLVPGVVALFMPALSSTMTHGTITKWHKEEGDKIEVGDRILVVESDKADMEVEAFDAGYLAGIRAPNGTSAAVGDTIAYIVPKREQVQQLKQALEKHLATGGAPISAAIARAEQPAEPSAPSQPQKAEAAAAADAEATEKAAQAAAAEWISPSVDQASCEQRLPGVTPQQLQQLLRHRLSSIAPEAAEALSDPRTSDELLKRMQLRPPPRVALLANPARFSSGEAGSKLEENAARPVILTPAAEALAAKHNVPVSNVRGSGFAGRITLADVKRHLGMLSEPTRTQYSCSSPNPSGRDNTREAQPSTVALSSLEKAIAKNMEATLNVPVFRLTRSLSVDALFDMVAQLKTADFAKGTSLSAEDGFVVPGLSVLLAKAVALTLSKHPLLNARFDAETQQVIHPPSVDVAMAVSIAGGLVTPVLKDAGQRDVFTLARNWRHQLAAAQARDFAAAGLTGGTFYISNLGMSGIEQFDALLPQNVGCIMAVGSVRNVLTPDSVSPNGLGQKKQMNVTLTCDHRHIYGQHAADFLTDLASLIEKAPNALLLA